MRDELHDALASKDVMRLQKLLATGELPGDELDEALTRSVIAEKVEFVRLLLEAGADPNAYSSSGVVGPAVLSAVEVANVEIIELIFSHGGDPNFAMAGGHAPLFVLIESFELAVPKPEIEALKLLIKLGARVDVRNSEGLTPAQFAERLGLRELLPYLVETTEDPEGPNP